jgi:hypothetical protein
MRFDYEEWRASSLLKEWSEIARQNFHVRQLPDPSGCGGDQGGFVFQSGIRDGLILVSARHQARSPARCGGFKGTQMGRSKDAPVLSSANS